MSLPPPHDRSLTYDFWKFWLGQAISSLGDSFSGFVLPLLVYNLTGSAINLAISSAAYMLPYLLFGLFIGAWADRLDRKRLMIFVDVARAAILATIPLLATFNLLTVWWIYAVLFLVSTLGIFFDSAQFAAIPSLVQKQDDLVAANGRIEASYSAARIIGPLLAGVLVAFIPIYDLIFIDAASFLLSAVSLMLIARSFNVAKERPRTSVRQDVGEGLKYVLSHPVLRNISFMMAIVNFVTASLSAQRILFAKEQLQATDAQLGLIYSANSLGVILLSLLAGRLRKRWPFSKVALGALMIQGILAVALASTSYFWAALPIFALMSGVGILFNINTGSLRQAIAPNHMLGRVRSIAGVLAWSAIPLGALLGGWIIEGTGNVAWVFGGIGLLQIAIPLAFALTPLGHAEDYLPKKEEPAEAA
ncbi:MAG: MFS transporter [Chloroflexia bacterium]